MTEWYDFRKKAVERRDAESGTMRLGAYPCAISEGTHAFEAYKTANINERHRHRYEFNNAYRERLADIMPLGFHIVALLKAANERNGDEQPPHGGHREADAFREHIRQHADHIGPKHIGDERDEERDARADVSPCKAVGRNLVHAFSMES